jgi:glutathione S-transferase
VLELYQAEWCPYSRRVRRRLTELQLDFVARQVPADPEDRDAMRDATSEDEIPVLLLEDGMAIQGMREILRHLDEAYEEGPEAEKHREQEREHER